MKRYKLIKNYPFSGLSLGTIVHKDDMGQYVTSNSELLIFSAHDIENYPEFWEKESEFKILKIIDNSGVIFRVLPNDTIILDAPEFINVRSNSGSELGNALSSGFYQIHSIERLSDGVIFTIGDEVNNPRLQSPQPFNIKGFIMDSLNEHLLALGGSGGLGIRKMEHYKPFIFKTEDGVDIFKGDKVYYVTKNFCLNFNFPEKNDKFGDDIKYFSSQEKAEEYVNMHIPKYSLNDIINSAVITSVFGLTGDNLLISLDKLKKTIR